MTYLDLLRDADRQLDDGRITIGEYEQMIKPLECEVQPEIVRCGECEHFRKEHDGEMWCGVSKGHGIDEDFFCGDAERRSDG